MRLAAMALTREFKHTVKARAERDPAFREALLTKAVEQLLSGEVDTGKAVLRLHQRNGRLRQAGKGDRHAVEEPHAHARPEG
jgi:hypothetical protein